MENGGLLSKMEVFPGTENNDNSSECDNYNVLHIYCAFRF